MLFSKNPPLNILSCLTCGSTGYVGLKRCPECRGKCLGIMIRNKFLYWGQPLTRYHLNLRRGRRILDYFRLVSAGVLVVLSIGYFFWQVNLSGWWPFIFSKEFWFNKNDLAWLFWLALIFLGYFIYRFLARQKVLQTVELRNYKNNKTSEFTESTVLQNWQEILKISRGKRKDISATFAPEAQKILEQAYWLVDKNKSVEVSAPALFYALLQSPRVATVFLRLGVPVSLLQKKLLTLLVKSSDQSAPILSEEVKQALFNAYNLAYEKAQEQVNVTELLSAIVGQSQEIQELLYDLDIDKDKLDNVTEWLRIRQRLSKQYLKFKKAAARRSKYGLDRAMTAVATPYLNSFSEDLTMAAKYGYLSSCVARDEEIKEIFRIIEGGQQSVVLVGEHGVGKMSIIEGLAQKMVEDEVPARLKDKRLVQLSTSAILAGVSVNGARERLLRLMHEVARAKNIILFIKNINEVIGLTDAGSGEGLDLSGTLAEFFGPGKFLTFSTSTTEGYNKHILNSALGSVLSKVEIKEMTENQAIQVLESKAGLIEYKHNVFFSYDAIAQCVKLSLKFLHDQNLPASAINIMTEAASQVRNTRGENQLVSANDVGAIIGQKTGIPTTTLTEDESDKLVRLEEEMHKRVVGQDEGVKQIADALRRARVEIRSEKKPIASFLFLGPTGVGKTELAKTIAEVYFGGEKNMIRLDMSEYQDKSGIYRLIGQPGVQGTGILTEAVRQKPFSLVLLDELEKADPDILTLFLQVFDDGRLTDSVGRVIDFTNVIIIATSNAGTAFVQEQIIHNIGLEAIRQQLIRTELKKYYRPEFLNRFDGIVLFKPLNRFEIKKIAGFMLQRVAKDLEKRGVELKVEDSALEALAEVGFDPEFGARPMRRAIQDKVESQLAELILAGKLRRRDVVVVGENVNVSVQEN